MKNNCCEKCIHCGQMIPKELVTTTATLDDEFYFPCGHFKREKYNHTCKPEGVVEWWEENFEMFYDKNECGGSSRWLVAPITVKVFIKGILLQEKAKWKGEISNKIKDIEGTFSIEEEMYCTNLIKEVLALIDKL